MKQKFLKIKFVGRRAGHQPLPFINDGSTTIVLPEDQSKAFEHALAKRVLKLAPELYKSVNEKGIARRKVYRSAENGKFVSAKKAEANPSTTVSDTI